MSKNLQYFVNNFVTGMALGNQMLDRRERADYRKQQLVLAAQKAKDDAQWRADKMGIETRRVGAYEKGVEGQYIKNTRPPVAKAGKAGPVPYSPDQQDWLIKNPGGNPVANNPGAGSSDVTVTVDPPDTVDTTGGTPADWGERPAGAATGGRMSRGGRAFGGAMKMGMQVASTANRMQGRDQWGRPINPDPTQAPGTTGPGSGYGAIATRPPMSLDLSGAGGAYRRGGAVRRFQQGGPVEEDMTDQYNTQLAPQDEAAYQQWSKQNNRQNDTYDYDMRGAWQAGERGDARTGHFPDTYKKPNHPTFSNESQYHGSNGRMGGHWDQDETGSETLQPYDAKRGYAEGGEVLPPYDQQYYAAGSYPWQGPDPATGRKPGEYYLSERPYGNEPRSKPARDYPDQHYPDDPSYAGRDFERRGPVAQDVPVERREFPYSYPPNSYTGPLNPQEGQSRPTMPTYPDRARPRRTEIDKLAEEPSLPTYREIVPSNSPDEYYQDDPRTARGYSPPDRRGAPGAPDGGNDSPDQYYPDDPRSRSGSPDQKTDLDERSRGVTGNEGGARSQTMPPTVVRGSAGTDRVGGGGGGARGGGQAISTGWKQLRDKTRVEAYDPQKDLFDPENVHAVDPMTGATKAALAGAASYADHVFGQGQIQGQSTGGEGAPMDQRKMQGKAAMFSGQGAADPALMQQIFQKVDPEGKMPMGQRMQAAITEAHNFYASKGDTLNADKSAMEIAQAANKMAQEHGKAALQAFQKGDNETGFNLLVQGYNTLPDGVTASREGGNVVLKDSTGRTMQSYPLDPRAGLNIALGMTSGELGWDVIRMAGKTGGQQPAAPPGAGPPPQQPQGAAQPSAAPAGPSAQPPAVRPPAPSAAPPAAAPAAPSPPPGGVPGRPAASPPASQTAVPAKPVSTVAPPAGGTKPIRGGAAEGAAGVTTKGDQGIETKPPKKLTPVETMTPKEAEQDFYNKHPYDAPPGSPYERPPILDMQQVGMIKERMEKAKQAHEQDLAQTRISGANTKPPMPKEVVASTIKHKIDTFNAAMREQHDAIRKLEERQHQQNEKEVDALKPRDAPETNEETKQTAIETRMNNIANEASRSWRDAGPEKSAAGRAAQAHANSPLRYAVDPNDPVRDQLSHVATEIHRYNRGHTVNRSVDAAVTITSIMKPQKGEPEPRGGNRQTGEHATPFRRLPDDAVGNVRLQVGNDVVHMPPAAYDKAMAIRKINWAEHLREKAEEDAAAAREAKGDQGISLIKGKIGKLATDMTSNAVLP